MTKKRAIEKLQAILDRQKKQEGDLSTYENDHIEADTILLDLIDDETITKLFWDIEKWYA